MNMLKIIGLAVTALLIGAIIYFAIPFSPYKNEFEKKKSDLNTTYAMTAQGNFSEQDLVYLPEPVQKYFRNNGYLGRPKMQAMEIVQKNVKFKQSKTQTLNITYTQRNYAKFPSRIALTQSSMLGVPFDSLDFFESNGAVTKGQVAKAVTTFNLSDDELLQGVATSYLSEVLIMPSAALRPFVSWESIDDFSAKATLTYADDKTVSGIFSFNEAYEMTSFRTEKRVAIQNDGSSETLPWTITAGNYKRVNDLNLPNKLQTVWHQKDGDFVYFDSDSIEISYR